MFAASPCSPVSQQVPSQPQVDAFGPDDDGRTFFASVQLHGTMVRADDFVLVDLEGAPRSIMQISVMWQQPNMPLQGEFRRLFRPDETFEGRKPYHGDLELLISTELLVLPLNAISFATRVESFSTFCHRQHFSQGVHYFTSSEYYDPRTARVLSKPSQLMLVSMLRQRLPSLPKARRSVPTLVADSPVPATLSPPLPPLATAAATAPSPQPHAAVASPDSPNAPGLEADDSPGAREAPETPAAVAPVAMELTSRFGGDLVPVAELARMREEDAEVERRATEVMSRLKRRAAAIDELLGSPERTGELTSVARTASAKKSPRSPTKKAAKIKPTRTLQFAVVK